MTRLLNLLPGAAVIASIASAQEYCTPSMSADYACMMSPAEAVNVHYSAMDDGSVAFMLEVPTEGFVALGSPAEPGVMIGANAVIGSSTLGVVGYFLGGKNPSLLEQYEIGEGMTVSREAHSIVDGISRLSFSLDPSAINTDGPNNFIYSYQSDGSPDLGYHGSTRGGLSIDFGIGPEMMDPCGGVECAEGMMCYVLENEAGTYLECREPMVDPCDGIECGEGTVCMPVVDAAGNNEGVDCMPVDPCEGWECPEGMVCVSDWTGEHEDGMNIPGCVTHDTPPPPCYMYECPEMSVCEEMVGEGGEMVAHCVEDMPHPCELILCPEGMMCEVMTGADGEMMADCVQGEDIPPTCMDGMMNGDEEGVDCGGPHCGVCMGERCSTNDDCAGVGVCECEEELSEGGGGGGDMPNRLRKQKKSLRHVNFFSGGVDNCFCKMPPPAVGGGGRRRAKQ